jgi:hypothetical protein
MLQRSTRKIYSIDEHSIDSVKHESIWHNKSPGKEAIRLVPKFIDDKESLNIVIDEVKRWKGRIKGICNEFKLDSANMEGRIDKFLEDPKSVITIC